MATSAFTKDIHPFPKHNLKLTIQLDGSTLHVNREVLIRASSVFRDKLMDAEVQELVLDPLVTHKSMINFLDVIYPGKSFKPMTGHEALDVIQLANHFKAEEAQQKCEAVIGTHLDSALHQECRVKLPLLMQYLKVCDKLNFVDLLNKAVEVASKERFDNIRLEPTFVNVREEIRQQIFEKSKMYLEGDLLHVAAKSEIDKTFC